MKDPPIAVVDREAAFFDLMDELLSDEGFRMLRCPTGANAQERIRAARPSLVILKLWLDRPVTGWWLLDDLRRDPASARSPVLICSTRVPLPEHQPIPSCWSPVATLQKPLELDDLLGQIRMLLHQESRGGTAVTACAEQSPAA